VSVWVAMCFGGDDGFISNAGDGFWLCWGHGDC
jgi:hypothetical protein